MLSIVDVAERSSRDVVSGFCRARSNQTAGGLRCFLAEQERSQGTSRKNTVL